ncbi:MAG: hypothetical protein JXB32_04865 [Deltaproteobacteria bacterium]|nr:hypothetical protein [Deltaproteobacteria bacterium]
MSRPTPLEIQDALFAQPLRLVSYVAAALAAVAFLAPWEVGQAGLAWTWDLWNGSEVFFLLPLAGGLLLAGAATFERVPGIALGAASLVLGVVWLLAAADGFQPLWLLLGGGDADRATLVAAALPLLLAALGWRLALHRTLVGRILLGLAVAALAALFLVPLGTDGNSVFQAAVLDRFAVGEPAAVAAAAPPLLLLLATLAAVAALLPSARSTGGLSTVARISFHVAAVSAACAVLLPTMVAVPDRGELSYGVFATPVKLATLWWCALAWIGVGAGSLAGALEAYLRREPLPSTTGRPAADAAAAPPTARPIVRGEPVVLPSAPGAAAVAAGRPLDLSPLPPPPGFGGPGDGVSPELQSKEPSEVVEIKAQHALPILDTSPSPPISRVAAPIPSSPPPATGKDAPPPALRGVRTVLGMPGAPPGLRPTAGGAVVPRPDQSGRTGDTSLGLPVAVPRPPTAKPGGARPPEDSGLRFWPPRAEDQPVRHDAATPAFGVQILRELATQAADPSRETPAAPGIPPLRHAPATAEAQGPAPNPEVEASGAAAEAVRFRVSLLQRQLARGELTQEEYRQRLDELRKPTRS